jgi:hypothetical protein
MPCHHTLEAYLHAYLDGTGIAAEPKGALFLLISIDTGGSILPGHQQKGEKNDSVSPTTAGIVGAARQKIKP